jgi:MFS family permease
MSTSDRGPASRRSRFGFSEIPGKVRWIIYANAFGAVGFGYLMVFITAYYPEAGMGSGNIGLILGAEGVAMVLSAVPLGVYSDRRGRKGLLLVASVVLPPSLLVFALTMDVLWLVLASIAAGVAEGAFLATWNAIIADQTTVEQRSAAFSLSFILGNVFSGVGFALPLAFPALEAWTGLDTHTMHIGVFIVTDLLAFVTPVVLYIVLRDYHETLRIREARPKGLDWKPLLKFSGLNGLIGLGAGFFIPLVPTWLFLKFAVPDTYSGPLLAVSNITIGTAAVVSAVLSKRYGPIQAVVLVQGLATAFMLSLAFASTALLAGALYLVRAALMNMASPVMDSFLMGIITKEQRGLASAVNSIVWRLPNSITTFFGGLILASRNYDLPIFLATGFYAVAVTGLYLAFRNVKPAT